MDYAPPPKIEPVRPAILRVAEPWERRVNADLIAAGAPLSVRQDVVRTLRKAFGEKRQIVRATADDLERHVRLRMGLEPSLFLGLGASFATQIASTTAAVETVFPSVKSTAVTQSSDTNTTSHSVNLPGSYSAGDLLLLLIAGQPNIDTTPGTPGGWTSSFSWWNGLGQGLQSCFYKVATGSEGATVSVNLATMSRLVGITYAIDAGTFGSVERSITQDAGASNSPDPPSLSPSGGSAKYLWIANASMGPQAASSIPGSFGDQINAAIGGASRPALSSCRREFEGASLDPSAFGLPASVRWVTSTIAIAGA